VDVLLPNDSELAVLGGSARVLDVVGRIVVTHGVRGASHLGDGAPITVSAPEVHRADSTGAGDAFNAGWLCGWLAGGSPAEALRAGVVAGTSAAARVGARPT
jgi:sugar/nucleoside kinase (ribokinase family)